jgi:hypothetical protein
MKDIGQDIRPKPLPVPNPLSHQLVPLRPSHFLQTPKIELISTASTAISPPQKRFCAKLLAFPSYVTTAVASRIFVGLLFALVHPGLQ